MTDAKSWMLGGASGLLWSNRKPALTAKSSSRCSLSGSTAKSILCIFPGTYAQTSKTVAEMPGTRWVSRACWAASLGPSAPMSISRSHETPWPIPRTAVESNTLEGCQRV
jgi:hypothetical protein